MSLHPFGQTRDGRQVRAAHLCWPDGLQVEVLEFGAIIRTLSFPHPAGRRNAVLSLDSLADYEADDRYIAQCVGRVANRIAGGRFPLDGREVRLSVNEPPNTLHGGRIGFGQRLWRFDEAATDDRRAALTYTSPAGEEGFPGTVEVTCVFTLVDRDLLEIAYRATTDAACPINLSHHLYFNLLGEGTATVLGHTLQIAAEAMTPVGDGMIPTGEIAPVVGGPLDLRSPVTVHELLDRGAEQMRRVGGVDFNWVLQPGAAAAVRLASPDGAVLEIETDQAGMQVYDGHKLTPPIVRHGAMALEPQGFPDSVNHPGFPNQIVRPGQTYRRTSRYRLSAAT